MKSAKTEHKGGRKKRLARWQERMSALGIDSIPAWKKNMLKTADDLRYSMNDEDLDFILKNANETQAENIMKRYRLS